MACGVAAVPFHALGPGALHAERAVAKPNALEVVDIEDYRHRGGQAEKGIVDGQAVVDPIAIGRHHARRKGQILNGASGVVGAAQYPQGIGADRGAGVAGFDLLRQIVAAGVEDLAGEGVGEDKHLGAKDQPHRLVVAARNSLRQAHLQRVVSLDHRRGFHRHQRLAHLQPRKARPGAGANFDRVETALARRVELGAHVVGKVHHFTHRHLGQAAVGRRLVEASHLADDLQGQRRRGLDPQRVEPNEVEVRLALQGDPHLDVAAALQRSKLAWPDDGEGPEGPVVLVVDDRGAQARLALLDLAAGGLVGLLEFVFEALATDGALGAGVGKLVVDIRVWIAAGSHRNIERGPRVGGLHWRAVDHPHRRGGPKQPTEIHRAAQINDLGDVEYALGHARALEFELAYSALLHVGLARGEGLVVDRGFAAQADKAHVLLGETQLHICGEIEWHVGDQRLEPVVVVVVVLEIEHRVEFFGDRHFEGLEDVVPEQRAVGAKTVRGRVEAHHIGRHRHADVESVPLRVDAAGDRRAIG